jgi:GntR family transcriptional regulator / MocR family aminotransferase
MDRARRTPVDEARSGRELLVQVELRRGRLRRSLAEALRTDIQDGRLPAGTVLPSSRRLAADLGVSRGVVSDTFDLLASEGYVELRPRSAAVVAAVAGPPPADLEAPPASWRYDFIATTPDVSLFPRRAWIRAVERALRRAPDAALDYGDHRGRVELRIALTAYLARVRGVRVTPGRIVVTQGYTQGLDLLCRVLVARGATALAMETPSLPDAWATVRAAGLRPVGCPVDDEGLRTGDLASGNPAAGRSAAVAVTPAHQFPTGAIMSPARRLALVEWAARLGAVVIEDDYDAEFRYDRAPVGAVQGLDPGRVVHVGTASKTMAPGVRLGWMSLPAGLVEEVGARKAATDSGSPAVDQLAFAELLASGEYERHVARARRVYRGRRDRLIRALSTSLPEVEVRGASAGMHVLLRLDHGVDDVAIADAAAAHGVRVRPLSDMHLGRSLARGLLIGYGRITEDRIEPAVRALRAPLLETGAIRRRG